MDKSSKTRIIKGLIFGAIFGILVRFGWDFIDKGGLNHVGSIINEILFAMSLSLIIPSIPIAWILNESINIQPSYFQVLISWALLGGIFGYLIKSKKALKICLWILISIFLIFTQIIFYRFANFS
jgi:hypothetical protein